MIRGELYRVSVLLGPSKETPMATLYRTMIPAEGEVSTTQQESWCGV